MNILILEDEPFIAYDLKRILLGFGCSEFNLYRSYEDAKHSLKMQIPCLAFIDIQLSGKQSGIDFADECKTNGVPFIFITAFTDKIIIEKAVNLSPIAYIVKPFKEGEILAALTLYKQKLEQSHFVSIPDGKKTYNIITNEVLYIEADTPYVKIHTKSRTIAIRSSLSKIIKIFNSDKIIRVHKSFAISEDKIQSKSSSFYEINNVKIPISKMYLK